MVLYSSRLCLLISNGNSNFGRVVNICKEITKVDTCHLTIVLCSHHLGMDRLLSDSAGFGLEHSWKWCGTLRWGSLSRHTHSIPLRFFPLEVFTFSWRWIWGDVTASVVVCSETVSSMEIIDHKLFTLILEAHAHTQLYCTRVHPLIAFRRG